MTSHVLVQTQWESLGSWQSCRLARGNRADRTESTPKGEPSKERQIRNHVEQVAQERAVAASFKHESLKG